MELVFLDISVLMKLYITEVNSIWFRTYVRTI